MLYVDCTASAIQFRENVAVFQPGHICIQLLRAPLVVLSAALTAYVEVHGGDDARKNQLCAPVPFPHNLAGYATATEVSMMNQYQWSQDAPLRQWLRNSRLDAFAGMVAQVSKSDEGRQAIFGRLSASLKPALANMRKLVPKPTNG